MTLKMVENLKTTVKTDPPLIVLMVCLAGLAITALSLTHYVSSYHAILSYDEKNDWVSILKYLNQKLDDVCLKKPATINDGSGESPLSIYVSVPASLTLGAHAAPKALKGRVDMDGWAGSCPNRTHLNVVSFTFDSPANALNESIVADVCVTLRFPGHFLTHVLAPDSCDETGRVPKSDRVDVRSLLCSKDDEIAGTASLHFKPNDSGVEFEEYLTKEERLRITFHLIVVSVTILMMVFGVTCYKIIFNKRHRETFLYENKNFV